MSVGFVVSYMLDAIGRAPHLYAVTAIYWALVAGVFVTRYLARRERASRALIRAVVALGAAALVLAFIDVAVRGRELIQISLVAYFATPLGIGAYWLRRLDGRPMSQGRGVARRCVTYVAAAASFILLSVVDGDPWAPAAPRVDRSSPLALIE
ncbi:MAG: hypothetical protein LBL01_07155, partial [Bifidobacteriaceae bacterium]|nr:hypothetical protein [Bifidobacteriaceae bacterium]